MPTYEVNGITWNYTLSGTSPDQVATIGTGTEDNGNATTQGISLSGARSIPDTVDGYTVTAIGQYAFRDCTGLTSITIPNSVITIGFSSFFNCTGLTSITIPNLVTTIGNTAVGYCSGLTSVTLGNSVISIGQYAFNSSTNLTSINIPDSVTTIGIDAFLSTSANLEVTMNTKTIDGTTYTSPTPTDEDISFFGNPSVTLVVSPPTSVFVTGKVPNWLQPKSGQYTATMGGYESQFPAWCSPTTAANQLGHLVQYGGVTQPANINDGTDAGNDSPFALAASTIAWDSGYGWGDYMLDGPTYRGKNLFNGVVSDFGWHMNTNNLGPLGASAGSAAGSTLQNIYNGMTDFYQQVGYTNMVGMVYHFNGSVTTFGQDPAYWTANGYTAPVNNVSADYAITLATIKHEIDNNRTVMACFNGWSITPAGHADLTGMTSGEDETGTYQTLGAYEPVGPHGEQFNIASTEGEQANVESYNAGLGHTVLIVGYIPAGAAQDPTGTTNWLVVRDNFTTTHKNVIIPFADLSKLLATIYVNHTTATYSEITVGGTDYEGTTVTFSTNTLTIENIIDANDTDAISFGLLAEEEMASLNVTNFAGTGTISYTLSATGATTITGTIVNGSVTVDDIAIGTNLLAGNPLIPGADTTYTLTLTANAAITYTIVGTKTVDYVLTVPRDSPPIIYYTFDTDGTNSGSLGSSSNITLGTTTIDPTTKLTGTGSLQSPQYTNAGADVPQIDYNTGTTGTTISFWAKITSTGGGNRFIYSSQTSANGNANNTTYQVMDSLWLTSSTAMTYYGHGQMKNITSPNLYDDNWHHFVITCSGGASRTLSVYVDNTILSSTITTSGLPDNTNQRIWLGGCYYGNNANNDNGMNGNIDDFRIYDYTLDATARTTLYNNGTPIPPIPSIVSTVAFSNNVLTIENSINNADTDVIDFVLPAGYEMADMSVTNFVAAGGTGTINYTIATGGSTVTSGTIVDDIAVGTNLLAGSPLVANTDTTYTLTLTANAVITYTIVGTKTVDLGIPGTTSNLDWNNAVESYIKSSNIATKDYFGSSVSISGNYAIVGASGEDSYSSTNQTNNSAGGSGAAYILKLDTSTGVWSQSAYLKASNIGADDLFGCSVSISGNYAIVGALGEDSTVTHVSDSGAAYIFERTDDTWIEKAYLKTSNINPADYFGNSVSISGNYAIVGAYFANTTVDDSGAAYIFERNGSGDWIEKAYLKASNLGGGDRFGCSVSISGDYAIVGALGEGSNSITDQDDNNALGSGAAYIFERNGSGVWNQTAYLKASNIGGGDTLIEGDNFGNWVSISGNYAIVSAVGEDSNSITDQDDNNALGSGAAYIFERNGSGVWNQTAYLKASNIGEGDNFGTSVSISGNYAIVSAQYEGSNSLTDQDDNTASNSGAAYVFQRNGSGVWNQTAYIKASNIDVDDYFGCSVSISGDYAIVGANGEDSNSLTNQDDNTLARSGAAYIFVAGVTVTPIITPTDLSFNNNILTIENSINADDSDVVSFVLPVADEMHQLVVTNYAGTGAINYKITTGETSVKTGTISNLNENSAIGTNLLDGTALTSAIGSTYQLTLSGATAHISYTIIGTKSVDYSGEPGTPTTLVFSNNVLTIDNVTSTTDTDVIDFVLPAGYNIPELNVTNFNVSGGGSGNVSYTLTSGGNTVASGSFSAISSNILLSGFPIFAPSTDITYVLTITTNATIGYTIVGTRAVTNLSNFTITQLLGSGYTEQQLIDAGKWNADSNANRFDPTYINGFVDISGGNLTVSGSILMDSGDIDLNSFTYTDPYVFSADVSLNNRLFVVGDVSMGDASLNVVGDMSINGKMSVGSYKPGSISVDAIAGGGGGGGGYSTTDSTTTFTEDIAYGKKIQFNGDISLNMHYVTDFNTPNVFESTDAKTTTPAVDNWQCLDMSTTGQYMVAVAGGITFTNIKPGNVWLSSDYGETWTEHEVDTGPHVWWWASISGDGSKIMVVRAEETTFHQKVIWRSTDSGANWTSVDWLKTEAETYKTGTVPMIMAYDGNHICSATMTNDSTSNHTYSIVLSDDGGDNWTTVSSTEGRIEYLDMSKSGQYIVVIYGDNATKLKYSDDYGVTFIELSNSSFANNSYNFISAYGAKVTISNTGKICYHTATDSTLRNIDVTTGTVSGTSPSETNDAAETVVDPGIVFGGANGNWCLNSSNDGKYILIYGYTGGWPRRTLGLLSTDYGTSFINIDDTSPLMQYRVNAQDTTLRKMKFGVHFSDDNKYVSVVQESTIYVRNTESLELNPNSTTYFGPTTTLKANSGIEFPDGTSISSSNISSGSFKTNDVVFKASTFNNMTVIGEFSSPAAVVTSDYRIKTNVETLDENHTVDNLRPVKYKQTQTGKNDIGFLAHELQEHYPELVEGEKDGEKMQSVNYSGLLPILINEVQQLKKQIAETRARIQTETP